ncbi:UV DNA damage repair endonuclease UvsE [Metabacillus litoralis]|uniref:UV DNA damage repair endonuclease UvsE n=1 Tax=Metabacillus litoralis TaxID=152268 RepID=A0A5C6V8X2_9BACI|nr:UV DNA damage repair endonuclease UvsE [Metabacillus litoralis]TXC81863.1 UV DNA damage repair endonuclease UvsE [Metabacillus litoralis]
MTIVRLGYVAMSMNLQNCSPSQTMTFAQFSKIKNRDAAIAKLEKIARSNLGNCLRLLKHNEANDIRFFRFSSKLIPLANHEELNDWDYMSELDEPLKNIAEFLAIHPMRVGFHPDHFVVLNSQQPDIFKMSLKTLRMHEHLLKGMGVNSEHRCVLHIGGAYDNKEKALEQFIHNWGLIPVSLQKMLMLENDDTTFHVNDALYLCEKLGVPQIFDYHHHLAYHEDLNWEHQWERVLNTWKESPLPVKMHISSPKSEKEFRAHSDYIDVSMFMEFLNTVKDDHTKQIDCMIEAKQKDNALFQLVRDLKEYPEIEWIDKASFKIK